LKAEVGPSWKKVSHSVKCNFAMEEGLKKEIEGVLAKTRPSLGGADIRFVNISQGIVTMEYYRPLSNPSACHVDRTQITKDIRIDVLADQLSKVAPSFKAVALVGKDKTANVQLV
jgi:hypothetical protein